MKRYANQSATADDLWSSFSKAIGNVEDKDEMGQFHLEVVQSIANWTHRAGYPIIHVRFKVLCEFKNVLTVVHCFRLKRDKKER